MRRSMRDYERLLATGGAGFTLVVPIGELVNIGHEVTIIDDLPTRRLDNIHDCAQKGEMHFLMYEIMDLRIHSQCADNVWSGDCDFFDLFAPRNPRPAFRKFLEYFPLNLFICFFATLVYERNNNSCLLGHPLTRARPISRSI